MVVFVARKSAVNLGHSQAISAVSDAGTGDVHDVFGMPIHDGIFQIETFQIADGRCLHLFIKSKVPTKMGNLGDVQFHQQMLLFCADELYI